MKKLFVRSIVLAAIGGLGVTSLVHAQDATPAPKAAPPSEHGMMMKGDMPGMMARMSKMMEACEKMMQGKEKEPEARSR